MVKKQQDERFTHITNCEIVSLFKRIPHRFGGYLIEVRYKIKNDDLFGETRYITIDQTKLLDELLQFFNGKKERLYYTDGMGDIDIFKQKDKYVIYWSPNDGIYVYHFFSKEEFNKLKNWVELENENNIS